MRKIVYVKCVQCDGTGKINTEEAEESEQPGYEKSLKHIECLQCNGTGKIETAYFIEV